MANWSPGLVDMLSVIDSLTKDSTDTLMPDGSVFLTSRRTVLLCPYWIEPRSIFVTSVVPSALSSLPNTFETGTPSTISFADGITVAIVLAMKLMNIVPTIQQSGMNPYVPRPMEQMSYKRRLSRLYTQIQRHGC